MQNGLVAGLAQQLGYWPNRAKALGQKMQKFPAIERNKRSRAPRLEF
jgi:hypothetical protein